MVQNVRVWRWYEFGIIEPRPNTTPYSLRCLAMRHGKLPI